MKKKKMFIVIIIIVFIMMLVPMRVQVKNGDVEYKAVLYKYTKIHRPSDQSATGYEDGWKLEILGMHVAGVINVYVEAMPKISVEELSDIQKEVGNSLAKYREDHEYGNFASSSVDKNKNKVIIELVDNSKAEQQWFRDNIYDSKYLLFRQGGPYYAY